MVEAKLEVYNARNYANFIIAKGGGGPYLGSQYLGMMYANGYFHASCAVSDSAQITVTLDNFDWNIYHTYLIRRNGNNFAFFIDGNLVGQNNAGCNIPDTRLIFGGGTNSGSGSAGWSWGYASGYYRRVLVFDKALSDDLISDFEF